MGKAFLFVIALGALIGFAVPTHRPAPAAAPVAASAPAAPAPAGTETYLAETKLARMPNGHFYADAMVNGQPVHLVVDTGSSSVALTVADAQRIGIQVSPAEFETVGTGASGPVRGKIVDLATVSVDGKEVRGVRGAVIEGLDVSLLGQAYLSRINAVEMSGDSMTLK
jgi:aspartyl protease family protein